MAITRRRLARRAHRGASEPAVANPPWATTSGTPPAPRASQYIRVAPIATSPVSTAWSMTRLLARVTRFGRVTKAYVRS